MPQGQNYYSIFQEDENANSGMTWQRATTQSYKKAVFYREKSLK